MKFLLHAIMITFFLIPVFAQQSVTIVATKDNTLYQDTEGLLSNGAGIHLFAGRNNLSSNNLRRAVIHFDLAGKIPSNAIINNVKLKMNCTQTSSEVSNIELHRLVSNWGEGTSNAGNSHDGSGTTATTGDATWKYAFFNTNNWIFPGGDFITQISATTSVNAAGSYQWTGPQMAGDVLAWIAQPDFNFGWIMIGDETSKSAKQFDSRNTSTAANRPQLIVDYTISTAVSENSNIPEVFSLQQNYPNPFNPSTLISFSIPQSGFTSVRVYDVLGNEVKTLLNQYISAGSHSVKLDGSNLTSGIFFYRLQSGVHTATKKLMILK